MYLPVIRSTLQQGVTEVWNGETGRPAPEGASRVDSLSADRSTRRQKELGVDIKTKEKSG